MRPTSSSKRFFYSKNFKAKKYIFVLTLSVVFFLILIFVNFSLQIKFIQIEGEFPKTQIRGLENLNGKNILGNFDQYTANIISQNNPHLHLDRVVKVFPDKLILQISQVKPQAALKLNKDYAILSQEGVIISKSKSPNNLTEINFYQKFDNLRIIAGNTLDLKEIKAALSLLSVSQELSLNIESIDINGLSMIVFKSDDKKIYFTTEKDIKNQLFELETIIKRFKLEAKDFKELDLRFDKPIVRF